MSTFEVLRGITVSGSMDSRLKVELTVSLEIKLQSAKVRPWSEAGAAFPFSILVFLMSGIESGAATLEFRQGAPVAKVSDGKGGGKGSGKRGSGASEVAAASPLRMVSRVRVVLDDGRISGDLVTVGPAINHLKLSCNAFASPRSLSSLPPAS